MQSISAIPFYAESLSLKSFCSDDIERIYNSNKLQMYAVGKKSSVYNCNLCSRLPLERQIRFKKLVCIFEYVRFLADQSEAGMSDEKVQKILEKIDKLFKKSFKEIYSRINMMKRNKETFSIDKCFQNPKTISLESYISSLGAIYYFLGQYWKDVDHEAIEILQSTFIERTIDEEKESKTKYNDLPVDFRHVVDTTYNNLQEDYITKMFVIGDSELDEHIQYIYDSEDLSSGTIFEEYPLSKKDLKELMIDYCASVSSDNNSAETYAVWGLHLKLMLRAYNKAKKAFFKYNQETMFTELEEKTSQLNKASKDLRVKEEKLNAEKVLISNENITLSKENAELKKTIKRLEESLKKANENAQELSALRKFAFSLQSDYSEESDTLDINLLNNLSGIVIGGHPNWQKKMKENLNWDFISGDLKSFDSKLLNKDIIVINTSYMSHALYYFTMNHYKEGQIIFVSKTNCDDCLVEIYEEWKNK